MYNDTSQQIVFSTESFLIFIIEIKLNTSISSDQHNTCCTAENLQTFSPILYNLV